MAFHTLLRRKKQLALLASLCRQSAPVRIGLRQKAGLKRGARLVALESDGLLVAWAGGPIPEIQVPGQPVEVRFEHADEHYAFVAVTCGRRPGPGANDENVPLLKLSLPLRVERAERRQHRRLSLAGLPPIMATFTHVVDDRRQFQAQLTNAGNGGLSVTARTADVAEVHTGDLFWVDVDLPGRANRAELIVRLVHLRPIGHTDRLALGCKFQAADDAANHERCLRQLEAVVDRARASANVAGPS